MGSVITPNTIDDIQRIYAGSFRRVRRGTASEERSITLNDTKAKTPGPKRRCQVSRALQLPCASKTVLRGRAGLIDRLFANKVLDLLRSAQGVISLAKALRAGRLEAACHRALSGITETLDQRNREAIENKMTYPEFLALIIQDEVVRRDQKKYGTRICRAGFRSDITLERFDFDFDPNIDRASKAASAVAKSCFFHCVICAAWHRIF